MERKRILITVKTYPTLSTKYKELVCTAGLLEDGSWIRLFPVPFRFLSDDKRYAKYQWIEIDVKKSKPDNRPESYHISNIDNINILDKIGYENNWERRRKLILDRGNVYTNLTELIEGAHKNKISLAVFKPTEILDFKFEKNIEDKENYDHKVQEIINQMQQENLFGEKSDRFNLMPKIPYRFRFIFKDDAGKESKMMIEDWEIGQLYLKLVKSNSPRIAAEKVKQKYFDDFAKTKDLYFFLGTTFQWHFRKATNPYVIVGTFHPPYFTEPRFL